MHPPRRSGREDVRAAAENVARVPACFRANRRLPARIAESTGPGMQTAEANSADCARDERSSAVDCPKPVDLRELVGRRRDESDRRLGLVVSARHALNERVGIRRRNAEDTSLMFG